MEVEDHPVFLELEHILQSQTVKDPQNMHIIFPLLPLRLEMPTLTTLKQSLQVLPQILLVNLLVQRTVLVHYHPLSLLVQQLYLVPDLVMHTLVKHPKHVVLLPHIHMDVLEVLLCLEQLPKIQLLEILTLHYLLQLRQQQQQLPYQEITDNIRKFYLLTKIHSLLSN